MPKKHVWRVGLKGLGIALAVVFAASVSAYLLLYVFDLGIINNGDGRRILRSAFVRPDDMGVFVRLPTSFPMEPLSAVEAMQFVPLSPSALLVLLIALASKLFGAVRFYLVLLSTAYFTLFYTGCLLLLRLPGGALARMATAAVIAGFLLDPAFVSYFFSVYEEAMVMAALPLWYYLAVGAFEQEKRASLFLLMTIVLVASKSTMVLLLLIPIAFCWKYKRPRHVLMSLFIVVFCGLALAKSDEAYDNANSFNRLYNGLAFSLSDVSRWPAVSFDERVTLAPVLVTPDSFRRTSLPPAVQAAWGHSYWPDIRTTPRVQMEGYVQLGKKPEFVKLLISNPHLVLTLAEQSVMTALQADYGLLYLQQRKQAESMLHYRVIFQVVNERLGWLLLVALPLLGLSLWRSRLFASTVLVAALVSPLLVVLGDGYFEFEKHLMPFLAITLFSIPLALRRSDPAKVWPLQMPLLSECDPRP